MQMTESHPVLNLFDAVHAAVQKIGVDATIRAVEKLSTQDEEYFKSEFKIVTLAVCEVYECRPQRVGSRKIKKRRQAYSSARMLGIYPLRHDADRQENRLQVSKQAFYHSLSIHNGSAFLRR
jgi:hypothetical protein